MLYIVSILTSLFLSQILGAKVVFCTDSKHVYIEDVNRIVGIMSRDTTIHGNLDSAGTFTSKYTLEDGFYSGPLLILLNSGKLTPQKACEYRSGRLVPGTIKHGGIYISELSGKIISFASFRYSPTGPRIWNLPGEYVTWSELAERVAERLIHKSQR